LRKCATRIIYDLLITSKLQDSKNTPIEHTTYYVIL
jgi:hypothetical protein